MSPKIIGRRMAHCRRLVAMRVLKLTDGAVFDSLAWSLGRLPFADTVICSYDDIIARLHVGRATVARAIKRLAEVGLLHKRQRWELVEWSKGKRWVQLANEYRFLADNHCEFLPPTQSREGKKTNRKKSAALAEMMTAAALLPPLEVIAKRRAAVLGKALMNKRAGSTICA
jgi:hypothetical protein